MLNPFSHFVVLALVSAPLVAFADDQPCGDGLVVKWGGLCVGEAASPWDGQCDDPESQCVTKYLWYCHIGHWESGCVPPAYLYYSLLPGGTCGPTCPEHCAPEEERACTPTGASTACGIQTCEDDEWSDCVATPECDDDGSGAAGGSGAGSGPGSGPGPRPPPGDPCPSVGDPIDVRNGFVQWKSHHDDAPLATDRGGFGLGRFYASRRVPYDLMRVDNAIPGSARALSVGSTPSNGMGNGWTHAYDHWLVIDTDVLHVRPDADSEYYVQDTIVSTKYRPDRIDGTLLTYNSGQWLLDSSDGSRLVFEGTSLARLVAVVNAQQQRLDLKYYGTSEPDSCSTATTTIQGKLCTIKDSNGSTIRLVYDSQGLLSETRYNVHGATSYFSTTYTYTGYAIFDVRGVPMQYSVPLLNQVDFNSVDKEYYTYTDLSYARADLVGYPSPAPIVVRRRHVSMLKRERDTGATFLSGHEYTADGRTAASISPGELLRVEYQTISSSETRVVVTNESTQTSAEYVVIDSELADVSDQCSSACSVSPAHYTRDANRKVTERDEVSATSLAEPVRSTFARDGQGRVTLYQRNWNGAAATLASDPDNASSPTHIERYQYVDADTERVSEASPVYSVACVDEDDFGVSCTGVTGGFEPKRTYDYDTDYDNVFNEAPGALLTQVRSIGLTITDIDTGAIGAVTRTTQNIFDVDGKLIETHAAFGTAEAVSTTYDYYSGAAGLDAGRLHTVTVGSVTVDERGGYDDHGRMTWQEDPRNGQRRELVYSPSGKVLRDDKVAGAVRRYVERGYTSDRYLQYMKRGAVSTMRLDYTVFDGQGATVPPANNSFCALDGASAVADCIASLGKLAQPMSNQHTYAGNYVSFERYTYDAAGNRVDTKRSDYNDVIRRRATYAFDVHGRREREFTYTDNSTTPAFVRETYRDALGRTVAVTDPKFASASSSHATNEADANRIFTYDALDRLVVVTEGATLLSPRATTFTYDAHDNLASMTDPDGRVTRYLYDDFGSLIAVKSPDSGTTLYRYDALGRQVEAKYADGRHTAIAYDTLSRVVSRTDTKGLDVAVTEYHYDDLAGSDADPDTSCMINENDFDPDENLLNGRLAWVSVGGMVRYFGYDGFGAITAVYEQTGSSFDVCNLSITRYSYDDQGRPLATTYPSGLRYRVDYGNREQAEYGHVYFPTHGEAQVANFTRDLDGEVSQIVFPEWNYVTHSVSRDFNGAWTRRLYTRSGTTLFDWAIDYDNDGSVESSERDGNGNILSVLDRVSGDGFVATMNDFDELIDYARPGAPGPECEYTYDGGGNRTSMECGSEAVSYSYESGTSRLDETTWTGLASGCSGTPPIALAADIDDMGGVTQYAKNGCPSDVHTIDYDATGSVVGFDSDPDTAITYDEQHLARTMGTNRKLTYDLQGRLLVDRVGDVENQYFWDGDELIFFITTYPGWINVGHAVGTDHLGAPWRAWAGSSTSWSVSYEPFGRVTPEDGATSYSPTPAIAVRKPGQIANSASALLQNGWRHYDGSTGRYAAADPLLRTQPGNRGLVYAYANNNPTLFYDPWGLACVGPVWQSVGLAQSYAHKVEGTPNANIMQFMLSCSDCQDLSNVHLEFSGLGSFDNSASGGDAPARIVSQGGSSKEYWVLAEVRTSVAVLVSNPDIKTCYDCKDKQ